MSARDDTAASGLFDVDADLVARMARGDQQALGVLYERRGAEVYRIARALVRDDATASDLVQDVFIEAWRRAEQYAPERGTVRAWLVTRARSRALDKLRSFGVRKEVALAEAPVGRMAAPEDSMEKLHLPVAFLRVNQEERAVLMLGYFEGLTCAEMSDRLGVPIGTIKSRTRTAMKKLREFWEEGTHED